MCIQSRKNLQSIQVYKKRFVFMQCYFTTKFPADFISKKEQQRSKRNRFADETKSRQKNKEKIYGKIIKYYKIPFS